MATQKEIAEHLDLSTRRIRELAVEGILPTSKGHGGYDLDACRVAYIRYLRGVQSGQVKVKTEGGDDDDYRELLEQEKWREKKRENDLAENLIAPISTLQDALADVSSQIVPQLEALPLEMKRLNPRLTGHDIATVKKCIARCRNVIAEIKLSNEVTSG